MDELTLGTTKRDILGKKTRFLRRQGLTPAHLFGHKTDSLALQCDTAQLKKIIAEAGTTKLISLKIDGDKRPKSVFIREVQKDAVSHQLIHVDFYQIRKGEKIKADIPIILVGEAPAMKTKGRMLSHGLTSLSIECIPEIIPSQIKVDISSMMEIEHPINVRDIVLDPGIVVHADPDQLIVKISEALMKAEEEEKVTEAVTEVSPEAAAAEKSAE